MTQDVQPLTWQKRTNLEEHQQFFSKINEIIDNLAPTVDEAEAAIAQATAAIASANDAIATANAASAAASAAASQAQAAATTVAGYDTRLIAVEDESAASASNIVDLQDRMGTAEGNITSLGTRMSAAESKNNQQDTAIAALQTADGQNVKISGTHAIGDYAVLLVNNQTKSGVLTMNTGINGIKYPVCDKVPENTANRYMKLFSITKRASMLMFTVKTSSQYMTVLADIRTNTVSVRTEIHGTTADRFANTDIIVMGDDAKYYFFMKYPQNRKFVLDFDNANPLFGNGTDAFVDIDTSFFSRELVDEPQIGDEYTSKYTSGAM